ncbi:MAG: TonB-dependent receptor, partial [bacterium]
GGGENGAPALGDSYVAETQLNFAAWDDRIHGVVGVFGFHENTRQPTNVVTDVNIFQQAILTDARIKNWDIASYSQISVDVFDWLEATAGIRWSKEKKGTALTKTTYRNGEIVDVGDTEREEKFTEWTPMASLTATVPEDLLDGTHVDHLMAYFTYSQGFRGGGFNSTATGGTDLEPFDPEFIDSFEVGFKAGFFERRLGMNLSAFLYNYDDLQVLAIRTDCTDPEDPTTCVTRQSIENAGAATGRGLELEFKSRPIDPLFITASVGLLETAYDEFPDAPPELSLSLDPNLTVNRAGQSFNNSPNLQTHISVMTVLPVDLFEAGWLNGYLVPRLDWYYQSEVHFNAPEVTASNQAGYNLLHARLSYDFFDDRAQVAFYAQNLTDQEYMLYGQNLAPFFGVVSAVYGPPRTYGAEISWRFD